MQELLKLSREHPELAEVLQTLQAVPEETHKGGASHEISSNGIYSTEDPKKSTPELGKKEALRMVESAVAFINAWKKAKL